MRVAITYEAGEVFQHFGRTEYFKIYDIEGQKLVSSQVVSSEGFGHGALAGVLANNHVASIPTIISMKKGKVVKQQRI